MNNQQAETALLGACLMEPSNIAAVSLIVQPEDFFLPFHRQVFEMLVSMSKKSDAIDFVTVHDNLPGVSFDDISRLAADFVVPFHAAEYARMVRESSKQRYLRASLIQIMTGLDDNSIRTVDALSMLDTLTRKLAAKPDMQFTTAATLAEKLIEEIRRAQECGDRNDFFFTGIKSIGEFKRADLIIIAGRPSMGKTALACNIAYNVASDGNSVAFVTAESPAESIFKRWVSSDASIDNHKLQRMRLSDSQSAAVIEGAKRVGELPLYIYDSRNWERIEAWVRALKVMEPSLALVVLDHVGKVRTRKRIENRYLEIGEISADCKEVAKDLDVAFLLLSQLNRSVEQRENKRPNMSDLRESGNLEQDADVIGLIYREFYYSHNDNDKRKVELDIQKNRDGKTGVQYLRFFEEYVKFLDRKDA